MQKKKKKKKKKFGHWLSIYVKSKPYLFSSFRKKGFFFLHFLGRFWVEKGIWSKTKGP